MFLSSMVRFRRVLVAGCVVVAVLALPNAISASDQTKRIYQDVTEGAHSPAIEALYESGILNGTDCAPNRFCPDQPMPLWVMSVWIGRAIEGQDPDPDDTHRAFPEGLADLLTTDSCSTGAIWNCLGGFVTRGQAASFLVQAFGIEPSGPVGFADIDDDPHADSINALAASGITGGCDTGPVRYCSDTAVTRGQMATFLARAVDLAALPSGPALALPDVGPAGAKHIVYGRGGQQVWLIEADGTLFDTYPVSGRATYPNPGRYQVYSKSRQAWSVVAGITMEYMVRFVRPPAGKAAVGFHDIPVYSNGKPLQTEEELGQFRSAGCVRQSEEKAKQLFEWAPVGTPVIVVA